LNAIIDWIKPYSLSRALFVRSVGDEMTWGFQDYHNFNILGAPKSAELVSVKRKETMELKLNGKKIFRDDPDDCANDYGTRKKDLNQNVLGQLNGSWTPTTGGCC